MAKGATKKDNSKRSNKKDTRQQKEQEKRQQQKEQQKRIAEGASHSPHTISAHTVVSGICAGDVELV